MSDTSGSNKEWIENRARMQLSADLFKIDAERKALQRKLDELDEQERRLLGLR